MKLRLLAVVVAVVLSSAVGHAQIGFYVNPEFIRVSNSTPDPGNFAFLGQNQTERIFGGVDFGAYYDAFHSRKLGAGLDVRDAAVNGHGAILNNFEGGVRISYALSDRWKPYIEPGLGYAHTKSPNTGIYIKKTNFNVLAGADFRLARHIDFRAIEIGYGSLNTASDGSIGGTVAIPSSTLIYISSGFVFRFR